MRKLSRKRDQRRALLKNLANNLILKEKIKTTETRAKETQSLVGRLVSKAKKKDLASLRYVARYLNSKALKKLTTTLAPKYKDRTGGYTRIVKLGARKSDGAKIVIIEFV